MSGAGAILAFFGLFAGVWKLAVVAAVTFLLFGRSSALRSPLLRALRPWVATSRPASSPAPASTDRLFVFLLVMAAVAVTALIVTRMNVAGAGGSPR